MPHPLPLLAAAAAAPLLGLAVHVASMHPGTDPVAHAASALPHNLCASCHSSASPASLAGAGALDARDVLAERSYLPDVPQG